MKVAKTLILSVVVAFGLACGYSKSNTPPVAGAMPTITQLTPASEAAGTSFKLEVDGTNFAANAVINFNGAAQTTTSGGVGKLEANIAGTAIMTAGTVPVTVTNPGTPGGGGGYGGGGTLPETSAPMNFTVN
jgi:hypothetical protein